MFREPCVSVHTPNGTKIVSIEDYLYNDRKIWIQGRITADMVDSILAQLMIIEDDYHSTGALERGDVDVTIYINSSGGSLTSLNLYDFLLHTPLRIKTVVTGYAYSAAALLFLAGRERCVMPYSHFMFHEPAYGVEKGIGDENIETVEHICGNLKMHKDTTIGIISERTGLDKKSVRNKITNRKWFVSAEEAVKLGIADKVIHRL